MGCFTSVALDGVVKLVDEEFKNASMLGGLLHGLKNGQAFIAVTHRTCKWTGISCAGCCVSMTNTPPGLSIDQRRTVPALQYVCKMLSREKDSKRDHCVRHRQSVYLECGYLSNMKVTAFKWHTVTYCSHQSGSWCSRCVVPNELPPCAVREYLSHQFARISSPPELLSTVALFLSQPTISRISSRC